jgi:hypothetical protein
LQQISGFFSTFSQKVGKVRLKRGIDVKALLAGDEEFLRALVRTALQEVLEAEMSEALSFWNIRKRLANWIMPRRTRALPALANPFSRRRAPLSSGEQVRPA